MNKAVVKHGGRLQRGGAANQKECRAPEEPGEVRSGIKKKGFYSFQPPFTGNVELIAEILTSKLELKMLWGKIKPLDIETDKMEQKMGGSWLRVIHHCLICWGVCVCMFQ